MATEENNNNNASESPVAASYRWLKPLLISIAAILLVIAAALTWLANDTERVRGLVENLVTTLTDRPFHINGDFDYSLGREITVTASQIEWANAVWSSVPTMLSVENARASVSLVSLLRPPIVITSATASNARLDFEWNQDGTSNWLLVKADRPPREKPLNPLPLLLDRANLQNIELRFRHPKLTDELIVVINEAAQQQDETNRLVLTVDSLIDGRNIELNGRIGPFPELVIARAVDFDLAAVGPYANMRTKGSVGKLAGLENLELDLAFSAPEFATVLDIFNLPEVTRGPAKLNGALRTKEDSATGSLKGTVGEFEVDGTFDVQSFKQLKGISAKLSSTGPSANAAFNIVGVGGMPREPYQLELDAQETAEGLRINSLAFDSAGATVRGSGMLRDFPSLQNIDIDLRVVAEDIARFKELFPTRAVPHIPFSLDSSIKSNGDGTNDVLVSQARLGKMTASANATLSEEPGFAGSTVDFELILPDTTNIAQLLGLNLTRQEILEAAGRATIRNEGIELDIKRSRLGAHEFTGRGNVPFNRDKANVNFAATAKGDDLANLAGLFTNAERVPAMPYDLAGTLSLSGSALQLKPLTGTIGSNNLRISGNLDFGKTSPEPDIDLQLDLNGENIDELLIAQGIEDSPTGQYSAAARIKLADNTLVLSELQVKTENGAVEGSISIGGLDDSLLVDFDIDASGKDLRAAAPGIPSYEPASVPYDIRAKGRLSETTMDIPELNATVGSALFTVDGKLNLSAESKASAVNISATGPSLSDIGTIGGRQLPEIPFDMSASIVGTENSLEVSDFEARAGDSDLSGRFQVLLGDKPSVDMALKSKLLDIRRVEAQIEESISAGDAPEPPPDADTKKKRLIPDQPLPIGWLDSVDARVQIDVDQFVADRLQLAAVNIDANLQDGNLEVENFSATRGERRLDANARIYKSGETPTIEVAGTGKKLLIVLGELDDNLRKEYPGQDIDLHLRGTGNTYRELAASLNGYLWLRGGKRRVPAKQIELLFGDFLSEVFSTLNPFVKKEPYQVLDCSVIFFEVGDGVVQTSPAILVRTDKLNMMAIGALNLSTEKIDFNLEATPRSGIGLSAGDLVNPFIKISGTLADPGLGLNPSGTLIEGGAAVATMGLSIVGKSMYKRWIAPKKTCETLTEDARAIRRERDPSHVPAD